MNNLRSCMRVWALAVLPALLVTCPTSLSQSNEENDDESMIRAIVKHPVTDVEKNQKAVAIRRASGVHKPKTQLIVALLDNLDFIAPEAERNIPLNPMSSKKHTIWPSYDALREIGGAVVPVILERLALTDDLDKHHREVLLLVDIEGGNGLRVVEEAVAVSKKRTSQLRQAAEMVKRVRQESTFWVEDTK